MLIAQKKTYTVKKKNSNTYEIEEKNNSYTNPKITINKDRTKHLQNLQNTINKSMSSFANSSLANSMNEQRKQTGLKYLGNGNFKITEVGSSGFVGLKKLTKRANKTLEAYTNKNNLKFKIKNISKFKQRFGVLPKVELEFTVLDKNNKPLLTTEEIKLKLKLLKDYFETDIITEDEYKNLSDELIKELRKRLLGL